MLFRMKTSNVQPAFAQGYGGQASLRPAAAGLRRGDRPTHASFALRLPLNGTPKNIQKDTGLHGSSRDSDRAELRRKGRRPNKASQQITVASRKHFTATFAQRVEPG
jgi:hypothetical protein